LLALGARGLGRLAPAARARVLLAAAAAPALGGVACAAALLADAELFGCHAHHCLERHLTRIPPLVLLLGLGVATRVGAALLRAARNVRRYAVVCRRLETAGAQGKPTVLPLAAPQAFVAGMLRPKVYVSEGLVATYGAADLEVVLAHEELALILWWLPETSGRQLEETSRF
jgi:Zn-dependent protease with chaperone function